MTTYNKLKGRINGMGVYIMSRWKNDEVGVRVRGKEEEIRVVDIIRVRGERHSEEMGNNGGGIVLIKKC